jgi:AcrR family transcriptional regulator
MSTLIATPLPSAVRDAENETREKLVAAAENLFAQHGYQGVSVRAIAAAAGVNWSLLGYYFRGKRACCSRSTDATATRSMPSASNCLRRRGPNASRHSWKR